MNRSSFLHRTALLFISLLLAGVGSVAAQNQTSDPLVDQQQYLFDVHELDQAWTYTTGSSNTTIGVYSMLGFIQNHEDLSSSRVLAPQGGALAPDLDFGSEMVGIVGAATNNGVGMAGIDRAARLQSYSALFPTASGSEAEDPITIDRPDGTSETYYLDLYRFSDIVSQGRSNGVDVHLFSFGIPAGNLSDFAFDDLPSPDNPNLGDFPEGSQLDALRQWFDDSLQNVLTGIFEAACNVPGDFLNLLGDCTSPPDPQTLFRETVGFAVAQDDQVVVAPAGDLSAAGNPSIRYLPAKLDRYSIAVGGITYGSSDEDFDKWPRTQEGPYVDVAGFAENVVGLSGTGSDQYNTGFGGTAAAASIGAGVASLLRAENASLSGEDIDRVLELTARDAAAPGRDDATGYGAIDAGAALNYVRNNDVQRATTTPTTVVSDVSVVSDVEMNGSGYAGYAPSSACGTHPEYIYGMGTLRRFTARVEYANTFSSPPDVWVRWGQSDGIESRNGIYDGELQAYFDPLIKNIEVVSADETGFTVEAHYWDTAFHKIGNGVCAYVHVPESPQDFQVAYTAVGTEGPPPAPPLDVSLSGTSILCPGESGSWTASVSGGVTPYTYDWYYRKDSGTWYSQSETSSSFSRSMPTVNNSMDIKVTVTDDDNTQTSDTKLVYKEGGCDDDGGGGLLSVDPADSTKIGAKSLLQRQPIPDEFALEQNAPNPAHGTVTIRFALPEATEVSLVVYDIMGREVSRLVDGSVSAGFHDVRYDTSDLASGVYLYRIETPGFSKTQRMTIVR